VDASEPARGLSIDGTKPFRLKHVTVVCPAQCVAGRQSGDAGEIAQFNSLIRAPLLSKLPGRHRGWIDDRRILNSDLYGIIQSVLEQGRAQAHQKLLARPANDSPSVLNFGQ
jgi:hypothetical protein